ncbi:MAG TPA: ribonuclease P [Candidatus Diapherotrites archaeon]|uniref:Ribonuclease P n=1 Tax=Candidatus Iainarchaeum sp. TaxID=3101447 RepID=A0A7J4JE61_9ARCH|nr:ribonuclease P [Candidatus Diapherotrites archaeon]HIH16052.1 ribonuclease P [Candidatus Diapherotrites archaeon]
MRERQKNRVEALALERIYRLFELAEAEAKPERAKRYVELARKISARNKARIPPELKKRFCKKCNSMNVQVAATKLGWRTVKCGDCGAERKAGK